MAVVVAITNALLAVVLILQYRANHDYPGPGWWAAGQSLVAIALLLSNLRGETGLSRVLIPLWQAIVLTGFMMVLVGLVRFFGRRVPVAPLVVAVVLLLIWSTIFTFGYYSLPIRSTGLYLSLAVVLALMARTVWLAQLSDVPQATRYLTAVFSATAVVYFLLAVGAALQRNDPSTLFEPAPGKTAAYLGALACTILWVFGLEYLLNERLQAKVATDADNMQRVFATSPDCAIISRLQDGVIVDVNDGFTRTTGFPRSEALGRSSLDISLWHDVHDRETLVDLLRTAGECENLPAVLRRRDGRLIDCLVSARTINLGAQPHLISITRDVTEQRKLEAQLQREATTDALTGVANRRHFLATAERLMRDAADRQRPLSLAIVDLDEFKTINDTRGHAAGDAALCQFVAAAGQVLPEDAVIGRLGGDEFGLLLPDMSAAEAVADVEQVASALDVVFQGQRVPVTISAGVAAASADVDVEGLIARADTALYQAKASGRNRAVAAGAPTLNR